LQAEEILKEAMRATPERMAIRTKLLEVYLKRRDVKGFELLATQLFSLTGGSGEDWQKAQELGRQIDPENPLYQPGGAPDLAVGPGGKVIEPLGATTMPHTAKTQPPAFVPAAGATLDAGAMDVDLELDVGGSTPPAKPSAASAPDDGGLDFDIPLTPPAPAPRPAAPDLAATQPPAAGDRDMASLDFDLGDLPLPGTTSPAAPPAAGSALDFDDFGLGSSEAAAPPAADGDPLSRKLELAEEFRQIGDLEGARDLLEEVIAKADGVLKTKAQGMLAGLG
jgi:pilus assembly protein FimV